MMRLWPRSLVGRTVFVLLMGVLVSNLVGVAVYSGERVDVLTSARGGQIAEQVAAAAAALQETPEHARRRLLRSMRQPGLRLFWSDRPFTGEDTDGWRGRLIRGAFLSEFGSVEPGRLRLSVGPRYGPPPGADDPDDDGFGRRRGPAWAVQPGLQPGAPNLSVLAGSYRLDDGTWLNFAAPVATFRPFWATPFFLVMVGTTALVLVISVWAVRRATAPLSMFGEAAERLGRDVNAPPLRVHGPLEVERAALAFNRMQERLQKFIRNRTQMLAAISHDLRTPLTRLRLRAELIEDEEVQRKTVADLDDMQKMIEAALSFARNEAEVEKQAMLDLAALLQTVCEEAADAGASAEYLGAAHAACFGRPAALKRAFANLVDNAVKYGDRARVTLETASASLVVTIEDDGPGLPTDELERVFEPFYRLETSRSRETGGAGLGLALVRAAIAAHGGDVVLGNRPEGGLRATVTLPVSAGFEAQLQSRVF
ncbi:MAG: ATP-binding protein [Rhodoplanes sp.]